MNSGELIEFFALSDYQITRDATDILKFYTPDEIIAFRDLCDIHLPDTLVIDSTVVRRISNFAPSQLTVITFSGEA